MARTKASADPLAPTPERQRHDHVALIASTIVDDYGAISRPYRVDTMLDAMERRRDITPSQRAAGEDFHQLFRAAGHDPLKAADLARVGGAAAGPITPHGAPAAQRYIGRAMVALGGHGSPIGSAAWFVLGCELSVADWARREGWNGRPIRPDVAKGLIVGALGIIEGLDNRFRVR